MKNRIHGNRQIDEISAYRLLKEIHGKAIKENDGKVHIREIQNNKVGKTIATY